ncbi:MAG: LuxR C-terminal-related transcriptional regulator [Chloroflexota bacterium]
MSHILLSTKIAAPAPRPELVPRPHLLARLERALQHRLSLVSAPAGFGKTTLLSAWAASLDPIDTPLAWISLDEGDNDPARFLAYLVAALDKLLVSSGGDILQDSPAVPPSLGENFLAHLLNAFNEIGQPSPAFVLILDDYHLITAEPLHTALAFLIDHLPPNLHLVIASRTDPPLPLARLRARGQLLELRQADLRFTPEEAGLFFSQVMHLSLSPEETAALAARTEGWAAGLQLAAISLQDHPDRESFIAAFTGSHPFILDYLLEEVLQRQPAHIQQFLLSTAILDQLSAPLCDHLLANESPTGAQPILQYLECANLFLAPLDDQRQWYRYHHLFADFLDAHLQQTDPERRLKLHREAAVWYERQGMFEEAIEHALQASDFHYAANLMARTAEATIKRSELTILLGWFQRLPESVLQEHASLCFYYAWVLLLFGYPFEEARARLEQSERPAGRLPGQADVLRAFVAVFQNDVLTAAELANRALRDLPAEASFLRSVAVWVRAVSLAWDGDIRQSIPALEAAAQYSLQAGNIMIAVAAVAHQAEMLTYLGELRQAHDLYQRALRMAVDSQGRNLPVAGIPLIGLGELYREWGQLAQAEEALLKGLELTKQWGQIGSLDGYIALALTCQARGDEARARQAIAEARQIAEMFDLSTFDDRLVDLHAALLGILQGDLSLAIAWQARAELNPQALQAALRDRSQTGILTNSLLLEFEYLVWIRLLVEEGRNAFALQMLDMLQPRVTSQARQTGPLKIHLLRCLALHGLGQVEAALDELRTALTLGEAQGHVRAFLDMGPVVISLLHELQPRGPQSAYITRLLSADAPLQPLSTPSRQPLFEALSQRELEVLRLLAAGLSNQQIAAQLVVAPSTVKTHINHLYRKLDVSSRTQATARARQLGLLP